MAATDSDVYYDPYDFDIDADPYPVWQRLRDERPLYYNERHDFYGLSRFEDVRRCSVDRRTYVSSKGAVLELVKEIVRGDLGVPAGSIIFEDPPTHDLHRGLLARAFTPRRMKELEPKVRDFCARSLESSRRPCSAPPRSPPSSSSRSKRHHRGSDFHVVNSMTVIDFDEHGKIRRLNVYLKQGRTA